MWALLKLPRFGGAFMQTIATIGLDIAKSVQVLARWSSAAS